jgi:hypothetical protein
MKLLELLILAGVAYSFKQRCKPKGGYVSVGDDTTTNDGGGNGIKAKEAARDDTETGAGRGNDIDAEKAKEASDANWIRLNGDDMDHSPKDTWPPWDGRIINASKTAWDGFVVYQDQNLQKRDGSTIHAAACVGGLVKGMYAAYTFPFAEPLNPTEQEVKDYTVAVIQQVFFYFNFLLCRYA